MGEILLTYFPFLFTSYREKIDLFQFFLPSFIYSQNNSQTNQMTTPNELKVPRVINNEVRNDSEPTPIDLFRFLFPLPVEKVNRIVSQFNKRYGITPSLDTNK